VDRYALLRVEQKETALIMMKMFDPTVQELLAWEPRPGFLHSYLLLLLLLLLSSSIGGTDGDPAYRTSAFKAVFTLTPVLFPPFISRGAPHQTA
jgi:hypothetical protein